MMDSDKKRELFEETYESLFAYLARRVENPSNLVDLISHSYAIFNEGLVDSHDILPQLYKRAYELLTSQNLYFKGEGVWANLTVKEAEILRLRFVENVGTIEIAYILGENLGQIDVQLYSVMMKGQELFPSLANEKFVGAYFSELSAKFKELKDNEAFDFSEDLKFEVSQKLFNDSYNAEREPRLPEPDKADEVSFVLERPLQDAAKELSGVGDFFNKPMKNEEKDQFSVKLQNVDSKEVEEQWVPEDKESYLPKDNPMGYGMDLLKTFMRGDVSVPVSEETLDKQSVNDSQSLVNKEDYLVEEIAEDAGAKLEAMATVPPFMQEDEEFEEFAPNEEVSYGLPDNFHVDNSGAVDKKSFGMRIIYRWGSPILALLLVILGAVFFPFKDDVEKFSDDYAITYTDEFSFQEKLDFNNEVLRDLVDDRDIDSVHIDLLDDGNIEVLIKLNEGSKNDGEQFVFMKLENGRWVPKSYQAIK